MAVLLMRSIWELRNDEIFREENFNINGVIIREESMVNEWDLRNELISRERKEGER